MLALAALLLLVSTIGFILGYGVREIISRRRRAAARTIAQVELYRELDGNQTLPRLEKEIEPQRRSAFGLHRSSGLGRRPPNGDRCP